MRADNSILIILLTISLQCVIVKSVKILSVEFFGSKSHVLTYLPLLEDFARRGHEITLVSPSKGLTKEKNIREIFTFQMEQMWMDDLPTNTLPPMEMKEKNMDMNPFTLLTVSIPKYCRDFYKNPQIKALMEETFDLVLIQPLFNDCALGLIHKINKKNAPLILFLPTSAPNYIVTKTGGYHPPSFVSHQFLGYPDEMTFIQRCINLGFSLFFDSIVNFYYIPVMEKIYREMLGQDVPSVNEILGNASIILANGHFSLTPPKPNLPDVVDVGGIHSRAAKPLPKDLEDFVSKSGNDGFILFSLGTILKGHEMSDKKRQIFLNVFSKLKQQVIWKYETEIIPNLPRNIKLLKWFPQQDLLGHPSCKLFITHCGLGGTEEAIFHGVPLVGMPFFGDQPLNAQEAENLGLMVKLEWNDLTEEMLLNAINEILNNKKYRQNVQRLSKVFRDQIDDPLQRGVWWMEYILRHKGAPHLRSAARNLNYFQYHSLDVMAAYAILIITISYLLYSVVSFFVRKILYCFGISSGNTKNIKKTAQKTKYSDKKIN